MSSTGGDCGGADQWDEVAILSYEAALTIGANLKILR